MTAALLIAGVAAVVLATPPRTPWRQVWAVTKYLFTPKPVIECRACEKELRSEMDQFSLPRGGIVCVDCLEKIEREIAQIIPKWFEERLSKEREEKLLAEFAAEATPVPGAGGIRELVEALEAVRYIPPSVPTLLDCESCHIHVRESGKSICWTCSRTCIRCRKMDGATSYGLCFACQTHCRDCNTEIVLGQGRCISCEVSGAIRNSVIKNMEPW